MSSGNINYMEEANKWMKKAEKDILAAEINFQQKLYDVSAFLSHQAAEKALKSLYIRKIKRLWKTHDLVGLLVELESNSELLEICDSLNRHYIDTRYPSEVKYTRRMAIIALENSKKVVEWAKKNLKKSESLQKASENSKKTKASKE